MSTEITELLAELRHTTVTLIAAAALGGSAALYIFTRLLIGGGHVTVSSSGWTITAGGFAFIVAALLAIVGLVQQPVWRQVGGFSEGDLMRVITQRRCWLGWALFFAGAGLSSIPAAVVQVIS